MINSVYNDFENIWNSADCESKCSFYYNLPKMSNTLDRGRGGLVVNTSDSGSRGRGFEPHSGRRVVSLSKTYLPPNRTGNTQEAVALSQHD